MTWPNFLVIGAAKSGTTSLRDYLDQHLDIFVTRRGEPSFFAHEGEELDFKGPGDDDWRFITDAATYRSLFVMATTQRAIGEISPRYLYFERASERIRNYMPEVRLIVVLRHPVDRAYSHFLMNKARDCEPAPDLAAAIAQEETRAACGWGWDWRYVGAGLYHHQLQRYYRLFSARQIKVLLYEDLKRNSTSFFREVFEFLDVDPSFQPDTRRKRREGALPRSHRLRRILEKGNDFTSVVRRCLPTNWRTVAKRHLASWNTFRPEPLAPDLRQRLFAQYFAEDCARLAPLLGRDLSDWEKPICQVQSKGERK